MYSFEEVQARVEQIRDTFLEKIGDRVLFSATIAGRANLINRISKKGLDSNDSKIGDYSTKAAYFTREQFARQGAFKPIGKNGTKKTSVQDIATRKKSKVAVTDKYNERQSMYLRGGYKELRDIQGRDTSIINLTYTGSLIQNINSGKISEGIYGVFLTSERESLKRKMIEKRLGKVIFSASPSDILAFNEGANAEIEAIKSEGI